VVHCQCHENTKSLSLSNRKETNAAGGKSSVAILSYLMSLQWPRLQFIDFRFLMQGIIVFASVMATLGLQILIESARQIISKVIEINACFTNQSFIFFLDILRSSLY
jgi:cobalamin biosynthesis protein CobD/CbiB